MGLRFFRHRRWLRATAYVFTLCTSIVRFLVRALGDSSIQSHTEAARILYGGRAISVLLSCSPRCLRRKSYGASAASAQRLRGDGMVNVRLSCVCVFFTISARPRRGPRAGIVRCYLQRLRATGFRFFKLVINSLNKMVESTAPVSP